MGFPSPASDFVEGRIDLNKVCSCTSPSVRMFIAERYHGMHINSGTKLLVDSSIKRWTAICFLLRLMESAESFAW